MKTSVVITTFNEANYIGGLLKDLDHQTQKPDEIIVVDGHSTDNTLEVVRKYENIKVIQTSPSIAGQRNAGADAAQNEFLVFLDADTNIDSDFLQKTREEFIAKNLDIACPFYRTRTKNILILASVAMYNVGFFLAQKFLPSGVGCCICIKKSIFEKSGGFNKTIKFEDIEFIRRVGRKNKFAMLHHSMYFSPRRFYEDGVVKMTLIYLCMSVFFMLGIFRVVNVVPYKMGNHQ